MWTSHSLDHIQYDLRAVLTMSRSGLSLRTLNQRNSASNKICYQSISVNHHFTGHCKNGPNTFNCTF